MTASRDNRTRAPEATAPALARYRRASRPSQHKGRRLQARLSEERLDLLETVAEMEGRTLSDFVVSAATEKAERLMREREVTRVDAAYAERFAGAMITPPRPNDVLLEAAAFYDTVMTVMAERDSGRTRRAADRETTTSDGDGR